MLVEQVDRVGAQPLQRGLDAAPDPRRAAVEAAATALEVEAELGRDHDLVADRFERLADQLLVRERPVDLRGVEEADAALDRRPDQRDALLLRGDRRGALAGGPAAAGDRWDFEARSLPGLLHLCF